MLLGTLQNLLTGKVILTAGSRNNKGKGILRADFGCPSSFSL